MAGGGRKALPQTNHRKGIMANQTYIAGIAYTLQVYMYEDEQQD